MTAKATEIAGEQRYFDDAEAHWQRWLAEAAELAKAGADKQAAKALLKISKEKVAQFSDSTAVAVGRIDAEDGETLYIGRQLIKDDRGEVLVVNWQAPAAEAYHEASLSDPRGLTRKRTFQCEGNTILDLADVVYSEAGDEIDAALLAALARRRDGEMRDIVATIQAAQFELIRAPLDQLLIVEGGPGTGKTEIALHRASWLLYHHKDRVRPADVLVIGPNPTFMRYISRVLPALGDAEVVLREIDRLAPEVATGRAEPALVAKLKGDERMADLIARGLDARIGVPEAAERLQIGNRYVNLPGPDVSEALDACHTAKGSYSERRQLLRDKLSGLVAQRLGSDPGRQPELDKLVERLWPRLSAPAFLRDLLGSRNRLATAAADQMTLEEAQLLLRRGANRLSAEVWSAADLPLLDEAEALLNGLPAAFALVVVDEVQDLSPMQLRSIARRARTGSLTIVGDLAQATGPWAADSWDQITRHLPDQHPVKVSALRYGYRVPEQILAYAGLLLPLAAPGVRRPDAVQTEPAEPTVHRVNSGSERADRVAATALAHSQAGSVGVICPPRCRREVEEALTATGAVWGRADHGELTAAITVASPREAKGLEFNAVIVVEPEYIVADDERGHRMLYIAFTRATTSLDVVCVSDPLPFDLPEQLKKEKVEEDEGYEVPRLADYLADRIRNSLPEKHWDRVLAMVRKRLER